MFMGNRDARLMGLRKIKDNELEYLVFAALIDEAFVRLEAAHEFKLGRLEAGFLTHLAERRLPAFFIRLHLALRKIPVVPAVVENEKFHAVLRLSKDDNAGGDNTLHTASVKGKVTRINSSTFSASFLPTAY